MQKKIHYAMTTFGESEVDAVLEVLATQKMQLIGGDKTREMEQRVATLFGKASACLCNSGSSANLLAMTLVKEMVDAERTQVITPALTFGTTIGPIVQSGFEPVLVDVDLETLQINVDQVKSLITEKTAAICAPNLIGNPCDWAALSEIKNLNPEILLVEDSADCIGYEFEGIPGSPFSDIVTTSFYASHIVTMGGTGGAIAVDDPRFDEYLRLLRGWGRSSSTFGESENIDDRFGSRGEFHYDKKFEFKRFGFNFQVSETDAAFGLAQLDSLKDNIKLRKRNHSILKKKIETAGIGIKTFGSYPKYQPVWLAFPLLLPEGVNRSEFQVFLERKNIQTRPIFTGNISRHEAWSHAGFEPQRFLNADKVHENGVLVGCHQSLTVEDVERLASAIISFF